MLLSPIADYKKNKVKTFQAIIYSINNIYICVGYFPSLKKLKDAVTGTNVI